MNRHDYHERTGDRSVAATNGGHAGRGLRTQSRPVRALAAAASWLDAFLVLATVALAFVVLGFLDSFFCSWQDIILMFFLAWLLSFALLPLIDAGRPDDPAGLPKWVAVIFVAYTVVVLDLPGAADRARGIARELDRPVHPGHPEHRRSS